MRHTAFASMSPLMWALRLLAVAAFIALLVPVAGHASPQTISLPPPGPITTVADGNFFAYSLSTLNSFGLLPGGIPGSSPGQIGDDLVLYTGTNNGSVNNNNSPALCGGLNICVDGPFQAPIGNGQNDPAASTFDTSAAPVNGALVTGSPADPVPNPWGAGDRAGTWDISIAALKTYLGAGQTPAFLLQQTQANASGCGLLGVVAGSNSCQDLFGWGAVYLWNSANAGNPGCSNVDGASGVGNGIATGNCGPFKVFEFKGPTQSGPAFAAHVFDPNNGICTNIGNAVDQCNPATAGTLAGVNALDHSPATGFGNSNAEFAFLPGQECLDAVGNRQACDGTQAFGPFNNNLGPNLFAWAFFSPGLNACLLSVACSGGFDTFSFDFKLRGLTDSFEQLVIVPSGSAAVPQPNTLSLLGTGLVGLSLVAWRLRRRA